MKHGEGITLTLTGRCPILCLATINNMAASATFALEKEAHSESHVFDCFLHGLTTFFPSLPGPLFLFFFLFFRVRSVAFFCVIYLFFLFFYFLLAKLFVELFSLKRCQLKTVV